MEAELVEFSGKRHLKPVLDALKDITAGPGEAAGVCLCLFVMLWRCHQASKEPSLDEIADSARMMILSYQQETEH